MPDDLARAWAFLDRADMAGNRTVPSRVGTAVYDDELPLRLDSNFLRVELKATPEEVLSEAERLGRRMIVFRSTEEGERLAPFFAERGWLVRRHLLMAQLRKPDRNGDHELVAEVAEEELRGARQRVVADEPWGKPEVMAQLFAAKHRIGERARARFFAVRVAGEVVSYSDLYQDDADAQVEDVGTLPEHRGHGYATAVVTAAVAAARADGAEFVFLVADLEDWPKELYRKLGFDELGYFVKLVLPGV
ncbi:MAG TPA: GNAT family N-acetyltransferase [Gaiellaceae bacterium]|nr:GNAT family N-acetyltransferase [Gaiellaceae bacterium]